MGHELLRHNETTLMACDEDEQEMELIQWHSKNAIHASIN